QSHKVVMMDDLYFGPPLPNSEMKFSHAGTDEDFDGLTQLSEQQDAQSETLTIGTADYKRPDLDKQVSMPAASLFASHIHEWRSANRPRTLQGTPT
ncbi:hypothetical protein QT614_22490, partial [Xanthomonas citri pv. citri]